MRDGFIKIAAATPDLHAADCAYNTSEIVKLAKEAAAKGAKLITFPELCLTGYTCGDLFLQETLLEGAMRRSVPSAAKRRNCGGYCGWSADALLRASCIILRADCAWSRVGICAQDPYTKLLGVLRAAPFLFW